MANNFAFLEPVPSLMVRQKHQMLEQFCAVCEKTNEYKVSAVQYSGDAPDDKVFKSLPTLLYGKEESTLMMRICCGRYREFTLNFNGNDAAGQTFTYIQLQRPFKCSILLCGIMMLNPQELSVFDVQGQNIGKVIHDYRCVPMLFFPGLTYYYNVLDAAGNKRFSVRAQQPTLCNGCKNLCAPTCLNRIFAIDIMDANETNVIGQMKAVFPGCNIRLCGDATNLVLDYPQAISGADKALLFGALMLIEYLFFEKDNQDQN